MSSSGDFWDDFQAALDQLDGSTESAVKLLTGATSSELDELGGFDEDADGVAHHPACDKYGDDSQCNRCND